MEGYNDIPRLYTALAEWLACFCVVAWTKKRLKKSATAIISMGMLIMQAAFLIITENIQVYFWIPAMLVAIGIMYVYIIVCSDVTPVAAGYYCARAFLVAEFAASLEWQLHAYFMAYFGWSNRIVQALLVFLIYGIVFIITSKLGKQLYSDEYMGQIDIREMTSAITVAGLTFLFSNLSFVISTSPFSGSLQRDIFNVRTLVDLCGIVILYAFQSRITEYMAEKELTNIQSMYKKQYDQYRYYQKSMEMVQIKYHDLKHQLIGLRAENDAARREEWIRGLEKELEEYKLLETTGNQVLDTVLSAKFFQAQENHIRITCVADGKLLNFMHVADICTIFGNALDNAIESVVMLPCQEEKLIHLTVSEQKKFVLINVANYVGEGLEIKQGTFPKTTKPDRKNHGFGLKSIKYTVEKYKGNMTLNMRNKWFELRILLPLPEEA